MSVLGSRIIVVAALASALAMPAFGDTVSYTVSGTFSDGGTFSGTFGYDPVANTFEIDGPSGQFDITTTTGSAVGGRLYTAANTPAEGYSDTANSVPTELYIDGCCHEGTTNLILDWSTPLNSTGGGLAQLITGGSETYQPFYEFPLETRQVVSGTVSVTPSPVPVPAACWLLLSGFIGMVGSMRRRVRASLTTAPAPRAA